MHLARCFLGIAIRLSRLFKHPCLLLAICLPLGPAALAQKIWTGTAGDTLWSTPSNWTPAGVPGPADNLTFTNLDFTDTPFMQGGAVNNLVDSSFSNAINSLGYRNINGVHNTSLLNPLLITGTSATDVAFIADDGQPAILFVGSGKADAAADIVYASIAGDSLTVSNLNANLSVMQGSVTSGDHWATLDLAGLNTFNCVVSNVLVAHDFGQPVMRPNGTLNLAVSNSITANAISLSDAYQNAGSGGTGSRIFLGQANTLNIDRIRIAMHKCVGTFSFPDGTAGASVTFRNKPGTGRQLSWEIGDEYEPDTTLGYFTSNQAIGTMDLTGGTVDAQVDRITLGRGQTNALTRTGDGNATLTFGAGTIDVNSLEMGIQLSAGGSVGHGILNLNNDGGDLPAILLVQSNLLMAVQLPGNTDAAGSTAVINLNGGNLNVAGDITDGAGLSTINLNSGTIDLMPPNDSTPGNIAVDILNITDGLLTNYATLAVSEIAFPGAVTQFSVYPEQSIAPAGTTKIGTLNVAGDLILRGNVQMEVSKTGSALSSDKIAVSGTLDLGGSLTVAISGSASLAAGDKFLLFTAPTILNSFTALNLPSPGPGLAWTNKLASSGSLEVISSGEILRPTITVSRSSGAMTLSWPAQFTTFSLRGQTNPATIGLSTNWGLVQGVSGNQITIQINPANETAFFQLIQP
jgi:hypothetical protein